MFVNDVLDGRDIGNSTRKTASASRRICCPLVRGLPQEPLRPDFRVFRPCTTPAMWLKTGR
jgi:hypothetical protein